MQSYKINMNNELPIVKYKHFENYSSSNHAVSAIAERIRPDAET